MIKLIIYLLFKRPIILDIGYRKFGKYEITSIEQSISRGGEEVIVRLRGV